MADLSRSLLIAIGKAALAKHNETCTNGCRRGEPCRVGRAHRNTLADLTAPAGTPTKAADK